MGEDGERRTGVCHTRGEPSGEPAGGASPNGASASDAPVPTSKGGHEVLVLMGIVADVLSGCIAVANAVESVHYQASSQAENGIGGEWPSCWLQSRRRIPVVRHLDPHSLAATLRGHALRWGDREEFWRLSMRAPNDLRQGGYGEPHYRLPPACLTYLCGQDAVLDSPPA